LSPPDLPSVVAAATLGSGRGAAAATGAYYPDSGGRQWWTCHCGTASSSSIEKHVTLPFPSPEPGRVVALPWPPATSIPGIWMPGDSSPFCHAMMSISFSVGSSLSSLIRAAWSNHMGAQIAGGVMKSTEHGSGLSLPSRMPSTSEAKSESQPCSNHEVSPSPVYSQVELAQS
jgi:hypothetical protein